MPDAIMGTVPVAFLVLQRSMAALDAPADVRLRNLVLSSLSAVAVPKFVVAQV